MRLRYELDEVEYAEYVFLKALNKKLRSIEHLELCDECKKKLNESDKK